VLDQFAADGGIDAFQAAAVDVEVGAEI
jgi:hypothetical protein